MSLDQPEALGAMVIGYTFHHGSDHSADVRRLLTRAVLARRQRKLAEPKRLGLDAAMKAELARVHAGKATPEDALNDLLQTGVGNFGQDMRGFVLETTSLDALEIPAEVLTQPTLHLEIGVTHHRPPGAAWAQLVILVDLRRLRRAAVDLKPRAPVLLVAATPAHMTSPPRFSSGEGPAATAIGENLGKTGPRRYMSCWVGRPMSKRRSTFVRRWPSSCRPLSYCRSPPRAPRRRQRRGGCHRRRCRTPVVIWAPPTPAVTWAPADTGGATDAATTDGPRDTGGTPTPPQGRRSPRRRRHRRPPMTRATAAADWAARGRSSAALPLVGALAGLGVVIRRRRRR